MEDYYELIQWFKKQRLSLWQNYSEDSSLNDFERKLCGSLIRYAGRKNDCPSEKQIINAKRIVEKYETLSEQKAQKPNVVQNKTVPNQHTSKHLTVRVAWHDSGWNGCICKSPEDNVYCSGEHSLLAKRIHNRKEGTCYKNTGKAISELIGWENQPPCYWCINIASENGLVIEHDNPAASHIEHIPESLPPHSIFTWPFNLSFVRDEKQIEKYGKYFPQPILEQRIKHFQSNIKENESIVFLYANYDNPVSGEENTYCVVGASFFTERGENQYFEISKDELEKIRKRKDSQNFPTLSWNLRYTLDYENNTILLPYHEYLEIKDNDSLLSEIKVTIDEAELISGFKYVAMDIDDDQAIFILMKMRKSIYKIKEHGIVTDFDCDNSLAVIQRMLHNCWTKRGYIPGFVNASAALLGSDPHITSQIVTFYKTLRKLFAEDYVEKLSDALKTQKTQDEQVKEYLSIIRKISDALDDKDITVESFITLSMLNLTCNPFSTAMNTVNESGQCKYADNPYLYYEEYEPNKDALLDQELGTKIDGYVDLFKIDIAFFPDTEFLPRKRTFQTLKTDDPKRIRALIIRYLRSLEGVGDCYDEADVITEYIKENPLFYRSDEEYTFRYDLRKPSDTFKDHLCEKVTLVQDDNSVYMYYYLKEIYDAEVFIKEKITELLKLPDIEENYGDLNELINDSANNLKKKLGSRFEPEEFKRDRHKLFSEVFKKRFYILTGTPGSGKSHALLQILQILSNNKETNLVLAPTGKAALRLNIDKDFNSPNARTIDKFLYNDTTYIWSNIIIDEMSMVDILKFKNILENIDFSHQRFYRFIIVGDQYQLPPIGFGKIFRDIIEHVSTINEYSSNYSHLSQNCRQETDDTILDLAGVYAGRNKNYDELFYKMKNTGKEGELSIGLNIHFWKDQNQLFEQIKKDVVRIHGSKTKKFSTTVNSIFGIENSGKLKNPKDNINLIDKMQIVSPYRTGFFGTRRINDFIQNESKEGIDEIGGDFIFKQGDKIICVSNIYNKGSLKLANGSMGIAQYYSTFHFPEHNDPLKGIDKESIELAYAITVHKSQGSGFDHVMVVLPQKKSLLSCELVYTALTRSRKNVSLFIQYEKDINDGIELLDSIRNRSYVERRKTSVFKKPAYGFSYIPASGVMVKSRVEYIIYKKLEEKQKIYGFFEFIYEKEYETHNGQYNIHPDFFIKMNDGRMYYWEHLGKLNDYIYVKNWKERLKIYKKNNDFEKLITTDELNGIKDECIEKVISDIIENKLNGDLTMSNFSKQHYSLGR